MPTINCFNQKKIKFGKPNKFYNLLSDDLVHIIAHVNELDSINSLSIQVDSTIIKCTDKFYINNIPIYRRTHFPILNDFQGFVEPKYNNFVINDKKNNPCILVDAGKYNFYVIKNNGYELISIIRNPNVNPTGIIGQTYKNIIDLPQSSYELNIKLF